MSITALTEHDYSEEIVDFSTICRTCAKHHDILIPIFSGEGLQNNLSGVINKYLPIMVSENDGLPGSVCYQCAHTLLAWRELVTCCQKAEDKLRARIFHINHQKKSNSTAKTNINKHMKWTPSSVNMTVNEILATDINIQDEDFFLQFVCQQCPDKPASSDIEQLTEHINAVHLAATDSETALRNFLTNIIKLEEPNQEFGSGYVWDTEKEHIKADSNSASTCNKIQNKILINDDNFWFEDDEEILTKYSVTDTTDVRKIQHVKYKPSKDCESETERENEKVVVKRNESLFQFSFTNYHCLFCSSIFPSVIERNQHMKTHYNSDDFKGIRCCEIDYSKKDDYLKHYQEIHQQEEYTSTLDPASGLTVINKVLKTPINNSRKNNKYKHNPTPCPHCKKVLCNRDSYRKHLLCHSNTDDQKPRFFCNDCGRSYNTKGNLCWHIKKNHLKLLPYMCKKCGKGCDSKSTLKAHYIGRHTNKSLYSCKICSKRFKSRPKKAHLMKHVQEGLMKEEDLPRR